MDFAALSRFTIRFWSLVADFASWLLGVAVDRGAYDDQASEAIIEAATREVEADAKLVYNHGWSDGYLDGMEDASRRNGARMQ